MSWAIESDIATLSLICFILLLSLLSLCFIFHLRFKTRTRNSTPLFHHFNSLWTVRFSLVLFIISWSLNELFRLRKQPFFLPDFTLSQHALICKIHLVLSLGLFQPGFLVILLFLVRVSIRPTRNSYSKSSFAIFFSSACFPLLLLQSFAVFSPAVEKLRFPAVFRQSSVLVCGERVACTYPLLSSVLFGVFGVAYGIGFVVSCWRVVSVVINKGLRVRIFTLAFTVLFALTLQIVFLGMSVMWGPADTAHGGVGMMIFLTAFCCAVVGEGILVISPITDTLRAGGDCCRWSPGDRSPLKECGGGEKQMVVVVVNGGGL